MVALATGMMQRGITHRHADSDAKPLDYSSDGHNANSLSDCRANLTRPALSYLFALLALIEIST